jgi:hypothetical protein
MQPTRHRRILTKMNKRLAGTALALFLLAFTLVTMFTLIPAGTQLDPQFSSVTGGAVLEIQENKTIGMSITENSTLLLALEARPVQVTMTGEGTAAITIDGNEFYTGTAGIHADPQLHRPRRKHHNTDHAL